MSYWLISIIISINNANNLVLLVFLLDGLSLIIELNRVHDSFYLKNNINYSCDINLSKILAISNIQPTLLIFSNYIFLLVVLCRQKKKIVTYITSLQWYH